MELASESQASSVRRSVLEAPLPKTAALENQNCDQFLRCEPQAVSLRPVAELPVCAHESESSILFCLRTYFSLEGTIYEQVKGTPMGSPISGFIDEAVLQRLESLVFQHHKPKFWAQYVDDTFAVIDRD
nr:unnamed protein product [Spirometra erinaceieuropaei]